MSSKPKVKRIHSIKEQDLPKLQKKFEKYDKDHNGYLDREEISRFMGDMVQDDSLPGLAIQIFDTNGDGKISFQEFGEFYSALKQVPQDSFILYRMLFDALDKGDKGYLNQEEMRRFFPYVIQPGQTIDEIITSFQKNGLLEGNGTKLTKDSIEQFFNS
ncbi:Calbindin [Tritrichomonas musculus]|uniref:Calbindin n=1 Tax=Tritrichomonas musculus TaxID=1915356 RepID=A0ABR2LBU8_9EUKA